MSDESITYSPFPAVRPWYEPHRSEPAVTVTAEELEQSYLSQWYRLSVGEVQVSLRPHDAAHNELWPAPTEAPSELQKLYGRYLLTWWNTPASVCSAQQREAQERTLTHLLSGRQCDPRPIAVFAQDSRWVEPGMLIEAAEQEAIDAAFILGQEVVVRLDKGGVTLIRVAGDRGRAFAVSEQFVPMEVRVSDQAPCPMSLGFEVSHTMARQGGPGTSRGHAVAAMWADYARVAHSLVHCAVHPHEGSHASERGRAIALYEIAYASRFCPMAFLKNNAVA